MSASLEAYLARLYLDADARRTFSADPRGAASRAGLDERDVAALEQVDRVGLELTARSLRAKRQARRRRGWLARLLSALTGGTRRVNLLGRRYAAMAEKERLVHVREGVVKYTKRPENKVPPSQRATASSSKKT